MIRSVEIHEMMICSYSFQYKKLSRLIMEIICIQIFCVKFKNGFIQEVDFDPHSIPKYTAPIVKVDVQYKTTFWSNETFDFLYFLH